MIEHLLVRERDREWRWMGYWSMQEEEEKVAKEKKKRFCEELVWGERK